MGTKLEAARTRLLALATKLEWLPPLVARVTLGWVFVETGWGKLHHLPKVIAFFEHLGIPAAHFQAPMVATFELVCGALVLAGLLTRVAVFPLIGTMIVAILTAKLPGLHEVSDLFGFEEYLYIVLFVWLAVSGPGAISVDRFLGRWWTKRLEKARA